MKDTREKFAVFNPRDYLQEYYSSIGAENESLLQFFVTAYAGFEPDSLDILEIGGGPTVYQLISAAPFAKSITFTDYLSANVDEVKNWSEGSPDAFSWDPFIERSLAIENAAGAELDTPATRRQELRQK